MLNNNFRKKTRAKLRWCARRERRIRRLRRRVNVRNRSAILAVNHPKSKE